MLQLAGCLNRTWDLRLVGLSGVLCLLSCAAAMNLMSRVGRDDARALMWLICAALVVGGGAWSLHFVSMLAFMPELPVRYMGGPTFASFGIVTAAAFFAFSLWRDLRPPLLGSATGGLLLGVGIAAMHYCAVAGMRLPGRLDVDDGWAALSMAGAIGFSALALCRARGLGTTLRRFETALWLTLGICALHFTAMPAVRLRLGAPPVRRAGFDLHGLAAVVSSVSAAILLLALIATALQHYLSRRQAQELRRLRVLGDLSQEGLLIHRNGVVLQANAAAARLLNVAADRLVGAPLMGFFSAQDRPALARCVSADRGEGPEELRLHMAGRGPVTVELDAITIDYEGGSAAALVLRDLTARRRDEARIRFLAHHDVLTELPNRAKLNDSFELALRLADRAEASLAILCLDLDGFKLVNDTFGHAAGDQLLREVADRLRAMVRASDIVARLGGDEFAVLQTNASQPAQALALAARLIDAMKPAFQIDGHEVAVGMSIGIAIHPQDGATAGDLMRHADIALYRAKANGRGCFCLFKPEMDHAFRAQRELERDLRLAIRDGQLSLDFQPLFDRDHNVIACEALARWQHPTLGMVPPARFIALAEETGLIMPLGEWVLRAACAAAMSWDRGVRVAVNLSPSQFMHDDVEALVRTVLQETGLPAERLELEITEGVLIENDRHALGVLRGLREIGVRLVLDDFGTGYSSLSYLHRFPFDKLKVDRSFVQVLETDDNARAIVNAIISMSCDLKLDVTAEGVETIRQFELLCDQGCRELQGYLLARPIPEANVGLYLRDQSARLGAPPAPTLPAVPAAATT